MFAKGKRKPAGPNRFAALQNSDDDDDSASLFREKSKESPFSILEEASSDATGILKFWSL
jgi:hypothetical protein